MPSAMRCSGSALLVGMSCPFSLPRKSAGYQLIERTGRASNGQRTALTPKLPGTGDQTLMPASRTLCIAKKTIDI